ncbi:MAG: DNA-deoxyinosine glycosylase [Woeseiaceae bacterium]|nr:DNA-deoxyinosine glycosylase [Woeseiaceae bacterium]
MLGNGAKILILGSLPGRRSLETGEYYAHARNAFWPIMRDLYGASGSYAHRCQRLVERQIAVWDVIRQAERAGSMDSRIVMDTVQPNDFDEMLKKNGQIGLIAFNGGKAASLYERLVVPTLHTKCPDRIVLPSTSPAHAAMSIDQKCAIWRSILVSGN